ncbi:MAG: cation:proton antiporter [Actinomycetes bacterium]
MGPEWSLSDLVFVLAGLAALAAAAFPTPLRRLPLSLPVIFFLGGAVVFALPLGLPNPDPVEHRTLVEYSAAIVVIISLMGAGLALDRPVGWRRWSTTWRLLAIAMPATIAAVALLGWALVGLPIAAALLLGAALAPTDPVLASDVQVGEPTDSESSEDEVRFALTSEAGLNDALAFPFVYAAIALAAVGGTGWLTEWALDDVLYKCVVGLVGGLAVGRLAARLFFTGMWKSVVLAEQSEGFVAVAVTLLAYGLVELAGGYGFLSVFVAACAIRGAERDHEYHQVLHTFVEQVERLLAAWLLLLLGGAVATGLLGTLTWGGAMIGLSLVFVVRPLVAWVSQLGSRAGRRERYAIAFFGVRGIGSIYYLAYAFGQADFPVAELWAIVAFTITVSIFVHGITATPVMHWLDRLRARRATQRPGAVWPPELHP